MPTVPNWKKAETRLAKLFGTVRRPLSGGNSRSGGRDDAQHPRLFIESKYNGFNPLWELYQSTKRLMHGEEEERTLVIGLHKANHSGILLVIHSTDLHAVATEYLSHASTEDDAS